MVEYTRLQLVKMITKHYKANPKSPRKGGRSHATLKAGQLLTLAKKFKLVKAADTVKTPKSTEAARKKVAAAKKSTKKVAAKKSAAKKSPAKKSPAKKSAGKKKATPKKSAAKKSPAKKSASKRPVGRPRKDGKPAGSVKKSAGKRKVGRPAKKSGAKKSPAKRGRKPGVANASPSNKGARRCPAVVKRSTTKLVLKKTSKGSNCNYTVKKL